MFNKFLLPWLVSLVVIIFSGNQMEAQPWSRVQKTLPFPDFNSEQEQYGTQVDVDGDYAVIGSPGYKNGQGRAFVVHFNGVTWENVAYLTASDGESADGFGHAVAINGDQIIVGALWKNEGAAYLFIKPPEGWADSHEIAKLTASDRDDYDRFGNAVDIYGDVAVVAAYLDDDNGTNSGAVYIFQKSAYGWRTMSQTAKLKPSDGREWEYFGSSVAIYEDVVAVGTYRDGDDGEDSGSAYIFVKPTTGWANGTETNKIKPLDGEKYKYFGNAIDMTGNTIVVGAYEDDDKAFRGGAAYIFQKTGDDWTSSAQVAKLLASNAGDYDHLGNSVSISGNVVVVGSVNHSSFNHNASGAAYVYEKPATGWVDTVETAILYASDANNSDKLGNDVAISGNRILCGSPANDDLGFNSGSAYIYESSGNAWISREEDLKLLPEPYLNDEQDYGVVVSIDSVYAVVGAPGFFSGKGCAYVLDFDGNRWQTLARLQSSEGGFGSSVDISGSVIVVGSDNNRAYIFEKPVQGWKDTTESAVLTLPDSISNSRFGSSVSISGDVIAVSAPGIQVNGVPTGAIYLFSKPGEKWSDLNEGIQLLASDGEGGDNLGYSLEISGDQIIAGTNNGDIYNPFIGSAYVFEKPETGWTPGFETAILSPPDSSFYIPFGYSVSITDSVAVVGDYNGSVHLFQKPADGWKDTSVSTKLLTSPEDIGGGYGECVTASGDLVVAGNRWNGENGENSGAAFIFKKPENGWTDSLEYFKIMAFDGDPGDQFGSAVGVSGNYILVGAAGDNENEGKSGSAYFFQDSIILCEPDSILIDTSVCFGEQLEIAGEVFNTAGAYQLRLFNQFGCDSILNILLKIHPDTDVFLGNDTTINVYHNYSLDAGDGYADYSWNTGDTEQSIILDRRFAAGVKMFAVRVTDQDGCANEDTIFITLEYPTSVDNINTQVSMELYPNPAHDHLSVLFSGYRGRIELQLVNDSGQILREMEFFIQEEGQMETLLLKDIPTGNYFLNFYTDSGVYHTQFVRQK